MIGQLLMLLGMFVFFINAAAHHGRGEFDMNNVVEREGTVTFAQWRNPHIFFRVDVEIDGHTEVWELEAQDLNNVLRRGVPNNAIKVGDAITFAGYPSTLRTNYVHLNNVLMADGLEIIVRQRTQPRWSERYVGGGDKVIDDSAVIDLTAGIFRDWSDVVSRNRNAFRDPPLTEAGREGRDNYNAISDDPVLVACTARGMPGTMTSAGGLHPFRFERSGDDIILRLEAFDNVRVIHMVPRASAEGQPFAPLGYSTGRWNGETLVVTTTRVDWPISRLFDPTISQSREVEFIERFTVIEEGMQLRYDIAISDPVNLMTSVSADNYAVFGSLPGIGLLPYDCAP